MLHDAPDGLGMVVGRISFKPVGELLADASPVPVEMKQRYGSGCEVLWPYPPRTADTTGKMPVPPPLERSSVKVRMTFTIPEDIARRFRELVPQHKRGEFVADAIREKLERDQLRQELIQGYIETYEEDKAINQEWEAAMLENWPEK